MLKRDSNFSSGYPVIFNTYHHRKGFPRPPDLYCKVQKTEGFPDLQWFCFAHISTTSKVTAFKVKSECNGEYASQIIFLY